jgi:cellulose synthase/poly-beta-1,6-N-acetylglucosamine synthase-like glycosyltransferase
VSDPWRPIRVCVIDLEDCPEAISGAPDYEALWALIRERGRPRGMLKIPFEDGRLSRERLTAAVAELAPATDAPPLSRPPTGRLPSISVVIPSMLERMDGLKACLSSLAALDYSDYEVIVVDNRPQGSPPVEVAGARLVRESRPGISAARNRGLAAATGEIIAFTDDDVEVDPAWLLAIGLRLQAHPEEACVTGLALPYELETPAQVALEEYYGGFGPRTFEAVSHTLRLPPGAGARLQPATVDAVGDDGRVRRSFSLYAAGSFGPGANMAFRAEALRELGGFDVALGAGTPARGGEDLVMFARLAWRGYSVGFEPAALVHHTHRRGDEELRRQIEGYGVGWGALLLATVLEDPRHVGRMLGTVPRGARALSSSYRRKLRSRHSEQPVSSEQPEHEPGTRTSELARLELRGIAAGPSAYLRSRRRWSR